MPVATRLTVPERGCLPVVVVVGETRQPREAALVSFLLALFPLPLFLPSPVLFEELQFAVHFLCCFSVQRESRARLTTNRLRWVNTSTSPFDTFLAFFKMGGLEHALPLAQLPPRCSDKELSAGSARNAALWLLGLTRSF